MSNPNSPIICSIRDKGANHTGPYYLCTHCNQTICDEHITEHASSNKLEFTQVKYINPRLIEEYKSKMEILLDKLSKIKDNSDKEKLIHQIELNSKSRSDNCKSVINSIQLFDRNMQTYSNSIIASLKNYQVNDFSKEEIAKSENICSEIRNQIMPLNNKINENFVLLSHKLINSLQNDELYNKIYMNNKGPSSNDDLKVIKNEYEKFIINTDYQEKLQKINESIENLNKTVSDSLKNDKIRSMLQMNQGSDTSNSSNNSPDYYQPNKKTKPMDNLDNSNPDQNHIPSNFIPPMNTQNQNQQMRPNSNIPITNHIIGRQDNQSQVQPNSTNYTLSSGVPIQADPKSIDDNLSNPYKSNIILAVKDHKSNPLGKLLIINLQTKKKEIITLKREHFKVTPAVDNFPFKFSKFINTNDHKLIITGGMYFECDQARVFQLVLKASYGNTIVPEITELQPMNQPRQKHNILYLPKSNQLLVAGGIGSQSVEILSLSDAKNEWEKLPNLQKTRSNATMFTGGNGNIFIVGGYDGENYVNSYEVINLNLSNSWNFYQSQHFDCSTMGVIHLGKNELLLIGGFKTVNNKGVYLRSGMYIQINDERINVYKSTENMIEEEKGSLFFDDQNFFSCNGIEYLIDYKRTFISYDKNTEKVTVHEKIDMN